MTRKSLILALVILLIILGAGAYLLVSNDDKSAKQDMMSQKSNSSSDSTQNQVQTSDGSYINYSEDMIAKTAGTKLLFFYAPWCPQCRALEADIEAKGVPTGVTIIKVDYDSNQSLRQKYGVTIQTTIVKVDDSGNLIEKYVAYDDPTLQSIKDNLL